MYLEESNIVDSHYPSHPDTILIKNEFYPNGLTERMVHNHYIKNEKKILEELDFRPVILFISTKPNELIVKRNLGNNPIILDHTNFLEVVHGRVLSLSVERGETARYFCVDIDSGPTPNEAKLKKAVEDVLKSSISVPSSKYKIISTSSGYHIYFYLKRPLPIRTAHQLLKTALIMEFSDKYIVDGKVPTGDEIKLDTTPTRYRGSHVVPNALCRNGLIAMDVTKTIKVFNRRDAIIK